MHCCYHFKTHSVRCIILTLATSMLMGSQATSTWSTVYLVHICARVRWCHTALTPLLWCHGFATSKFQSSIVCLQWNMLLCWPSSDPAHLVPPGVFVITGSIAGSITSFPPAMKSPHLLPCHTLLLTDTHTHSSFMNILHTARLLDSLHQLCSAKK